jgi:flagellar protein FlbD
MIKVTRLNHVPLFLNSDLIEHIDMTPDTVITLTTGQKFMVLETVDDVVDKIVAFRRSIAANSPQIGLAFDSSSTARTDPASHGS